MCNPFFYKESDIDRAVQKALEPIREVWSKHQELIDKLAPQNDIYKAVQEAMKRCNAKDAKGE